MATFKLTKRCKPLGAQFLKLDVRVRTMQTSKVVLHLQDSGHKMTRVLLIFKPLLILQMQALQARWGKLSIIINREGLITFLHVQQWYLSTIIATFLSYTECIVHKKFAFPYGDVTCCNNSASINLCCCQQAATQVYASAVVAAGHIPTSKGKFSFFLKNQAVNCVKCHTQRRRPQNVIVLQNLSKNSAVMSAKSFFEQA